MSLEEVTQDLTDLAAAMDATDSATTDEKLAQLAFVAQDPESQAEKARLKGTWQTAIDLVRIARESERNIVARAAEHAASTAPVKASKR